jgi:P-type Cu2+ transporter
MPSTSTVSGLQPAAAIASCKHCGLPFKPSLSRADFCCAGCQFVHRLIQGNGLEKYYELRGGDGQPVKPLVFQERDLEWLSELQAQAEAEGVSAPALALDLQGITCVGCVWLIERVFQQHPGAVSISVNAALGQARLQWQSGACDLPAFARTLQSYGYLLAPAAKRESSESRSLAKRMGICAALAMNCMLFTVPIYLGMEPDAEHASLFATLTFVFATLSMLIGGSLFIRRAAEGLRRGLVHIDLPIALGVTLAYIGSVWAWQLGRESFLYFDFVTTFIFLMLVGRWTQQLAIEKNRNYLLGLQNQAQKVTLLKDGSATGGERVEVTQLLAGADFLVSPGQFVPVRSELLSAEASVGMEWINGESEARSARRGQLLPPGAINVGGRPVAVRSRESWSESLLASLLTLQPRVAPKNALLQRVITTYLFAVLAVAGLAFAAWLRATGDVVAAAQVLISTLVVSCPCAIGVAWPLIDELAASYLRNLGVFVREHSLWHRLAHVRKILFDKTGTLTLENLALLNPSAVEALTPAARRILLSLADSNLHPVSRCLREHLMAEGERPLPVPEDAQIVESAGFGVELAMDGSIWRLGRPGWAGPGGTDSPAGAFDCQFSRNGQVVAAFRLGEELRADAADEVASLVSQGYEVWILSGDRREKVAAMATKLGLPPERCLGELTPEQKADVARRLGPRETLMIGDGANDSLAFDEALCRGTPAVDRGLLEQKADFYFLGRGLGGIRQLFEETRRRRTILRRLFTFAILYNAAAVTACVAGLMNPLVAAVIMPASGLFAILSGIVQHRWSTSRQARGGARLPTGEPKGAENGLGPLSHPSPARSAA